MSTFQKVAIEFHPCNIYLNPLFLQRHIRFMCKHDATIIEKKRITVDLKNVGKLVSEATQFSKVKNSQHQAASIIWVHEQYIQGDIFCWHIFVRSSVSSGHTCLSGHCLQSFTFNLSSKSSSIRLCIGARVFIDLFMWLGSGFQIKLAWAQRIAVKFCLSTCGRLFLKSIEQKCDGEGFIYQV